ncbi:MAG: zinc ribbon domain-containing protein [Gemmataceae bacterium]|nr:zinc ribbon domain-containing protein [Gemmataceae bacterium]
MPTYDYLCDACGHTFEMFQSFSAAELTRCPKCGEEKLRRLFGTGAALIFKGSGFYETDYRSDSYKKAAEAETKSSQTSSSESKSADSSSASSASGNSAKPASSSSSSSSGTNSGSS